MTENSTLMALLEIQELLRDGAIPEFFLAA